jgi:DNA invertase Pin-like site-specific DNA recombinase
MFVGYMRISSESDRQNTNLQKDALLQAGVDPRHIFEDKSQWRKRQTSWLGKSPWIFA